MKPNQHLEKIQKLTERAVRARGTKDEPAACRAIIAAQIGARLARCGSGPTKDARANEHQARGAIAREVASSHARSPGLFAAAKRIEREAALAFLTRSAELRRAASTTAPTPKDAPLVKEIGALLEKAKKQDRVDAETTLDKVDQLAAQLGAPPDGLSDRLSKVRAVFASEFSDEESFRAELAPLIDAVLALFGMSPAQSKGGASEARRAAALAVEVLAEDAASKETRFRALDRVLVQTIRSAETPADRAAAERLRANIHARERGAPARANSGPSAVGRSSLAFGRPAPLPGIWTAITPNNR